MDAWVDTVVGVIGRAHGVKGEVAVEPRTDEPERRFAPGVELRIESSGTTVRVRSHRWHSGRLLVRFEGMSDRNAAEAARGGVLVTRVDPRESPEDEDEYYDRQLVGLDVVSRGDTGVGVVREVVHLPGQDLLVVEVGETTRLVPLVRELVPRIDLGAGQIEIADRPGLLDDAGAEIAAGDGS
mgnify:CR=1 FL=1